MQFIVTFLGDAVLFIIFRFRACANFIHENKMILVRIILGVYENFKCYWKRISHLFS